MGEPFNSDGVLLAALSVFLRALIYGLSAAISAAISAPLFWWLIIERPAKPSYTLYLAPQ